MSIIIMQSPALVAGQSFPCPSGNTYLSTSNGLLVNVATVDESYLASLGARIATPRNNWSGSRSPTVSDDAGQLFDTGSVWIWQTAPLNPSIYLCTSGFPLGAATWVLFASESGLPIFGTIVTENVPLRVGAGGTGLTTYGPLINQQRTISTAASITNADKGKTIICSAGDYTITVGAASGFDNDFQVMFVNTSTTNSPVLNVTGLSARFLAPLGTLTLQNHSGTWRFVNDNRRPLNITGAAIQIFVNPSSGSNSNSGINSGVPVQTIAQAITLLRTFDHNGLTPEIKLAQSATYDVGAGLTINYPLVGSVEYFITGQTGTTSPNVIINCNAGGNCVFARDLSTVTLQGVYFTTSGNSSVAVLSNQGSTIDVEGGFAFGNFPIGTHMQAGPAFGSINVLSNYGVYSNCNVHLLCDAGGYVNYGTFGVDVPNPLTFTYWAVAQNGGTISAGGVAITFSGAGAGAGSTGQKYISQLNAVISKSGSVYPGATAGTTATGGQAV